MNRSSVVGAFSLGLVLLAGSAWASSGPEDALDAYILGVMEASGMPGLSAAVTRDGALLWSNTYGYKRLGAQIPADRGTLFNLASISKTAIATAVLQAVEDQLFGLDDDINGLLPFEVHNPNSPPNEVITPRMLLSHVAGIRDNWTVLNPLYTSGDSPIPLGEFLADYLVEGGAYYDPARNYTEAGAEGGFTYSNIGATLAAYLVEYASGMLYHDYCRQRIFEPLGMERTSYRLEDLARAEVAMPYSYNSLLDKYLPKGLYGYPDYPDGGLRASATELSRFLRAFAQGGILDGERILSEESVAEAKRVQYPELKNNQGLSWYYRSRGQLIGHDGDDRGVHTRMSLRLTDGVGVILLANSRSGEVSAAFRDLEARLYEEAAAW